MTQDEYDRLDPPDPNLLYLIVDAFSFWREDLDPPPINDGGPGDYTIGLRFDSSEARQLRAVWFYSLLGREVLPSHIGHAIGTNTVTWQVPSWSGPPGSGWVRAAFTNPPTLRVGENWVMAYANTNFTSWWVADQNWWPQPDTTAGPLTIPAGTYPNFYGNGQSFPNASSDAGNYWLDVEVG